MMIRKLAIAGLLTVSAIQVHAQAQYVYDRETPLKNQAAAWSELKDLRRLDLRTASLTDALLVDHVAGLTTLQELMLLGHRATPKGVAALSSLKNLRSLSFERYGAGQEKALFSAISDLPLVELRMNSGSINSLDGMAPLRCRETLQRLEIRQDRKELGDEDVAQLAGFTELRHLDLSGNTKIRKGIAQLTGLKKLESLTLYGVPFVEEPALMALFENTPRLTHLDLGFCWWVKGKGLVFPASLQHLTLIECKAITDAAFEDLPCRDSLIEANLFQCLQLSDASVQAFKGARKIENLNVGCIRALTNKSLKVIGGLETLTHLNISDNDHFDDAGLANLAGLKRLRSLNLWHLRGVTGTGLSHIAKLSDLVELNLADCENLQDNGVVAVAAIPALERLYLDNCSRLTDQAIAAFAGHKRLKVLTLSGCEQLTDASTIHLSTLRSLTYLDLRGCPGITDSAIAKLRKQLPDCRVVR